ncbi:MAG: S26 family signal peptidase [Planctomycetota bacterium]
MVLGLASVGVVALVSQLGDRVVIANTTASVQPGLYVRWPGWCGGEVKVGELVSIRVPEVAAGYFAERAGRPSSEADEWSLLKPVAAGPGQHVDSTGDRLLIDGIDHGPIYRADALGRELPSRKIRRVLGSDEWLLLSDIPGSIDGRYFGPVRSAEIEAVRVAVWTWDHQEGEN